jgi:hypothetical protein
MAHDFIQAAIKHKGALHKQLGIPQGKTIPHSTLAKAAQAPGLLGQRARLAITLGKMRHG